MNRTARSRHSPGRLTGWCVLVAVFVVSKPLQSVDLWWDLARGREVLAGAIRPCQNLLTLDNASEAAWLGGVPFWWVWSVGGIFALAAIPLAVAAVSVLAALRGTPPSLRWLAATIMLPLTILATRAELEPTSALFDLAGLLGVWLILEFSREKRTVLIGLAIAFGLWANLGPRPIWGVLLVMLWPGVLPCRLPAAGIALLAGMITPRGPLTWLDAVTLFAPTAFVPSSMLEPRWRGLLTSTEWTADLAAGIALGAIVLVAMGGRGSRRSASGARESLSAGPLVAQIGPAASAGPLTMESRWTTAAGLVVPAAALLLSRSNLPLAGLWVTLQWLTVARRSADNSLVVRPAWARPAMLVVTAVVVVDACGWSSPAAVPLGWGLSQAIDPRLLAIDVDSASESPLIGWCPDSRSAGVAAWLGGKRKLVDHPQRALLGGRTHLHAEVVEDLLSAHQSRYLRDDNSWGGWAFRLRSWNVDLLYLPAESFDLNRSLLETFWKPIKLDSPTVPYVRAENPRFDRLVINVMQQQSFVETGSWQPSLDSYDPQGWRVEAASLLGLGADPSPAVRQSTFFRSIKLPMAALRSLAPVRGLGGTRAVQQEFLRCQETMAHLEWGVSGKASLLRRLTLTGAPPDDGSARLPWEAQTIPIPDAHWRDCLVRYQNGQPSDAAESLSGSTFDEHYARGLLWLEGGDVDRARDALQSASKAESVAVKVAAVYWLGQLSSAEPATTASTR